MRAAVHARKLAMQRQTAADEARRRREDAEGSSSSSSAHTKVVTRADVRASHRHKLWKALHANDWERHVHLVVDYEPEPLRITSILSKEAAMASGGHQQLKIKYGSLSLWLKVFAGARPCPSRHLGTWGA